MGTVGRLLTIGGGLWIVIGLTNIFAGWTRDDAGYDAFLLMFNAAICILPGGVVAGLGAILRDGARRKRAATRAPSAVEGRDTPDGNRQRHDVALRSLGFWLAVAASLLAADPTAAQSPLPLASPPLLVGVIIPETGEPMAILEDPQTHEQRIHPIGAQIGEVRLTKILKDRVVLSSGNAVIEVRLAGPVPPPSRSIPSRVPSGRARPIVPR